MNDVQHEAYRPVIEDGWGIFPEDLRVSKLRADPAKPSRRRLNADSHTAIGVDQAVAFTCPRSRWSEATPRHG